MSYDGGGSIAQSTGTNLDSGCKHIQQCRVSQEHLVGFAISEEDVKRNKTHYCVHKDELVVGVNGKTWTDTSSILAANAYPRVVSSLGKLGNKHADAADQTMEVRIMRWILHNTTSIRQRNTHLEILRTGALPAGCTWVIPDLNAYLCDFTTVGYANTMGFAHGLSGDTMTSVMIGGLRTVMNGDFAVEHGDLIQWYWPFERSCFNEHGHRLAITPHGVDPGQPFTTEARAEKRQKFHDRQYGNTPTHHKMVPQIKPYREDEEHPRLYDWHRVFARAMCNARPNERFDIQISRQSA